jgi:tetratricopeptide (TPR) repeat protein
VDRSAFGAALRRERIRQGLSLTALARLIHYSKGYLSRVETGRSSPTLAVARACDQALSAGGALAMLVAERPRAWSADLPRPAQLPAAVAGFTGRSAALAELGTTVGGSAAAVVISAIGGMAGIGKTALAVQFAHQVAGRFPDGQLYVNLRGFDPSEPPLDPAAAVRGFLDALQIPAARIPPDPGAQAGLYRSLLAGLRVLVLADNARDAAQVRPLLPGAPGCLVLVTSRHQMAGLAAADGARLIDLDLLTEAEAHDLLTARIGEQRAAAEPAAVREVISLCGRLPLALAIVAARAAARPAFPLGELAAELAAHQLDALAANGDQATDLRAVFFWSYRALDPQAARLFRLLGLHPGPDITAQAAASLARLPSPQARKLLGELADAHLISEPLPGRYALHDLLRAYAVSLASQHDTPSERRAATHRMLDHYLYTSSTGADWLNPTRDQLALAPPQPGAAPESISDTDQAVAWFTAEQGVLLAAVERAASDGFDSCAWQLAWVLRIYYHLQGRWHDQAATQQMALSAADRLGDPQAQAGSHRGLGVAYAWLGRAVEAYAHFQRAIALHRDAGDQVGQGRTYLSLTYHLERQHRYTEAVDYARHALDLFRAAGDERGQADAMNAVGWQLCQLGEYEQALTACSEALAVLHKIGDRYRQAYMWDSLGYAHHHLGEHDQAVACYQRALRLIRQFGDRVNQAAILGHLGDTHHAAGRLDAARTAWRQALTILDDLDDPGAGQVRAKLTALQAPAGTQEPAAGPPSP